MTPVDDRRALAPYYEAAEDEVEAWDEEDETESEEEAEQRVERAIQRAEYRREAGHARR